MDSLLPSVPYRQWVLALPKRLRYFIHRNPRLAGEITRILCQELTGFYRRVLGVHADATCAPALIAAIQRFGSRINVHVHVHVVASDGLFVLTQDKRLVFLPLESLDSQQLQDLSNRIRRKILKRMRRLQAVPEETIEELIARPIGGFSLNGEVRIEAQDRAGLQRLLSYCLRPAISLKRLSYKQDQGLIAYRPVKGPPGAPEILLFTPIQFLQRLARIIAPPRFNLVRYVGALGPRSPLRPYVVCVAQEKFTFEQLCAGVLSRPSLLWTQLRRGAKGVSSAAAKAWAVCLARIFEVYPLLCPRCGTQMRAIASITNDAELVRLLSNLQIPTEFPKTKPARAPPALSMGADSQINPIADAFDGIDQPA